MHPPPTKLFDPTAANASSDLAMMACRRATATTTSSAQNISISFDGLAELLCGPMNKITTPTHGCKTMPCTLDPYTYAYCVEDAYDHALWDMDWSRVPPQYNSGVFLIIH